MRRRYKVLLTIPVLILLAVGAFFWAGRNTTLLIFPEVWSQSSPEGDSYEFKVNQFMNDDIELEVGFLSTMDHVMVTDPSGRTFELERDFNINEYSGRSLGGSCCTALPTAVYRRLVNIGSIF